MKVLQISPHFSPNLGGVETHLDDLVFTLNKKGYEVFVLTYRPLQTKSSWKIFEDKKGVKILRIPWVSGLFYRLINRPVLEFLYLFPGIFLVTPFAILFRRPDVIHSHGLVAGVVAVFWGKIFKTRTVISTHNIYNFPPLGVHRELANWVFNNIDHILCLSSQSAEEIKNMIKEKEKVSIFTSWVNLRKFYPLDKEICKTRLGWKGQFVVLFVGRLVSEKGIPQLLKAAKLFRKGISLKIAGSGPLEDRVGKYYIGKVSQEDLPLYYSASDVVVVPSTHDAGLGRVIIESLACGTPVIGSNRGAIPQVMNGMAGKLIDVTPENIRDSVELFYKSPKKLKTLSLNSRKLVEKRYSDENVKVITESYIK